MTSNPPNIPPMGEPHFERPPKPGFDEPGPHGDMPPFCPPPGHPGPHPMRKPPLSREHLLVHISESPEGIRQKALMEKGISEDRITTDFKGSRERPFANPAEKNRVSICVANPE